MSIKNMTTRTGEFILSDETRSRDVVLVSGGPYQPGEVLGIITSTGKYKKHDPAKDDGTEDAVAILYAGKVSGADKDCVVITRDAEVDGKSLDWGNLSADNKAVAINSLASVGIIVR